MIVDGQSVSVAATSTTNAFLGRPVEFIGVPSVLSLALSADAAAQQVQLLVNIGGDQKAPIAAGTPIAVASAAGAGPKEDEDYLLVRYAVPAGARLQLNITNTTAGAVVTRYRAKLE